MSGMESSKFLKVIRENIPKNLTRRPHWVCWRSEDREGKATKVPYDALHDRRAKSNDYKTWCDFDKAYEAYENMGFEGIGFVLTKNDPFVGIDLDHCHDPRTAEIKPWAQEIIDLLDSYTEISPSGTGIRIFVRGELPEGGRKKQNIELYDCWRYLTVTGHRITKNNKVFERDKQIRILHRNVFGTNDSGPNRCHSNRQQNPLIDQDILQRGFSSRSGARIKKLYEGDFSDYPSRSEADLALCGFLARYTKEERQIDRLFRASGLMRDKWDEQHYSDGRSYGEEVIRKAINNNNRSCPSESSTDNSLSRIYAKNEHLPEITQEAWTALIAANDPPSIFKHPTGFVRLEYDDDKGLFARTLGQDHLRHILARTAYWYKVTDSREEPALPPMWCVKDMLVDPDAPLPYLSRIVSFPLFASDGTLHFAPGYHASTRCYYEPQNGLKIPKISQKPTGGEIERARERIVDLLWDFPFTSESEKAHAIALLILPFVRYLIAGATPVHLFEAPLPGSGKTLCAQALTYPALGAPVSSMPEGRNEEEYRKRITSVLLNGPTFVLLDNVTGKLESGAFSSAITSSIWEDRILGKSQIVRLPISCGWIVTANNPSLSSELTRRTVRIRLDPKMDRPWTRDPKNFRHPELLNWARENRGELIWAALTMAQAWIAEGCPEPEGTIALGMFEGWSRVMGGILQVGGVEGFLSNLDEFYEATDAESRTLRSFIECWWDYYEQEEVGASELFNLLLSKDIHLDLGRSTTDRGQKIYLGKLLSSLRDRQFGNYRVEPAGTRQRANLWKLTPMHITQVVQSSSQRIDHTSNEQRENIAVEVILTT